eukprot:Tbor_TRINITY_DN2437_c0_g1::TRINITY_DN2437_c0_g1_i1::g.2668::m.2668
MNSPTCLEHTSRLESTLNDNEPINNNTRVIKKRTYYDTENITTVHNNVSDTKSPTELCSREPDALYAELDRAEALAKETQSWRQIMREFRVSAAAATVEAAALHRHGLDFRRKLAIGRYYKRQQLMAHHFLENDTLQRKAARKAGYSKTMENYFSCGEDSDCEGLVPPGKDKGPTPLNSTLNERDETKNEPLSSEINTRDEYEEMGRKGSIAARGSLFLNIILLIVKIVAAIQSGSLTIVAAVVDSALDLFSGGVVVAVGCLLVHSDTSKFPMGKHRFESLGTLIFSCVMFVASAKLIEECAERFADISLVNLTIDALIIGILIFVIVSKIIAYILCRRYASYSVIADALAKDHRNDVITNGGGFVAILLSVYYSPWFDPIAAFITTIFVMCIWAKNAYDQAVALSGHVASPEYHSIVTMLARNHDKRILGVDTVRAVTCGQSYIVEIDLLLPEDMLLHEAHDIGETLQVFLEQTQELDVARAYVHLDYETDHNPFEHR